MVSSWNLKRWQVLNRVLLHFSNKNHDKFCLMLTLEVDFICKASLQMWLQQHLGARKPASILGSQLPFLLSAMKCYMSRPKILHRNPSGQTCWKNPTAVHNLRSPNKKHLKLNWSFQTLQTCSMHPVLNKIYLSTSTLVQRKHDPQLHVVSDRLFPMYVSDYRSGASLSSEIKLYPILPWLQAAHRPGCRTSRWLQLRSTRPGQPAIKRCSRKTRLASCVMWKVKVQVVKFMIVWILIVLNTWYGLIWSGKVGSLKKGLFITRFINLWKCHPQSPGSPFDFGLPHLPTHWKESWEKFGRCDVCEAVGQRLRSKNCVGISSKTGAKARLSESATRTLPC